MEDIFVNMTSEERIECFYRLITYPEVEEHFSNAVLNKLHEYGIFNRLDAVEKNLGADELHCVGEDHRFKNGISEFDYEREPLDTVPVRLANLCLNNNPNTANTKVLIGNTTEIRAHLLKEKLSTMKFRNHHPYRFMDSKEIGLFLMQEVPQEYKCTENYRGRVIETVNKAIELYPDCLKKGKMRKGNKTVLEYLEKYDTDRKT